MKTGLQRFFCGRVLVGIVRLSILFGPTFFQALPCSICRQTIHQTTCLMLLTLYSGVPDIYVPWYILVPATAFIICEVVAVFGPTRPSLGMQMKKLPPNTTYRQTQHATLYYASRYKLAFSATRHHTLFLPQKHMPL